MSDGVGGGTFAGFFEGTGTRIRVSAAICSYMTLRSSAGRSKKVVFLGLDGGGADVVGVGSVVMMGTLLRRLEGRMFLLSRLMVLEHGHMSLG